MKEHRPEVADIFRQHEQEFLERWRSALSDRQLQTLRDIGACRTTALGAHLHICDRCQRETIVPNSCLNRHCPKRGSMARDRWLEKHSEELLPTAYAHVIFTLPHELIPLALQTPTVVYNIFFRAVSQALLTIAADPHQLGARLGFLAVLHTWNQKLLAHPHIHCLVPAGGMAFDQTRWISCRYPKFFLPGKVLAAKFRGKFLTLLRRAFRRGKLQFRGTVAPLQTRRAFDRFTWSPKNKDWIVYAKEPFAGPRHVIKYLAHYTHRVAIANGRLVHFENGQVTFRWRDSAHGNQQKIMTLDALEFMRRFLLHVLPRGFVKIRHFGFLANRERKRALPLCSVLLSSTQLAIDAGRAGELLFASRSPTVPLLPGNTRAGGTAHLGSASSSPSNPGTGHLMIRRAPTNFVSFAHRLCAFPPDVCPKSFPIDKGNVFHLLCRSILRRRTSQMVQFPVFRNPHKSPNCHSKRRSFSETASFK